MKVITLSLLFAASTFAGDLKDRISEIEDQVYEMRWKQERAQYDARRAESKAQSAEFFAILEARIEANRNR